MNNTEGKTTSKLHIGFIISVPFHLFHHGKIRRHLDADVTVYVDVRDDDFGLTVEQIRHHMGDCQIKWIPTKNLHDIDGDCDVLVCNTPVTTLKFFTKTLVVAEQYSLAKESYQYGVWRSQADLNLMYGPYSSEICSGFSTTVATGNPLFDGHVPPDGLVIPRKPQHSQLQVLYMPTYGDLSNREEVIDRLVREDVDLTIKAHHADFEIARMAGVRGIRLYLSDTNPIDLISKSDLVVSDYSGAIYDAIAMRTPVVLVDDLNSTSKNHARLSDVDISRTSLGGFAVPWANDVPIRDVYEMSRIALSDDVAFRGFIEKFYANFGNAGLACANHITELATIGIPPSFATTQVREATRRYIQDNRKLRAQVKKLKGSNTKAQKTGRPSSSAKSTPSTPKKGLTWVRFRKRAIKQIKSLPGGIRILSFFRAVRNFFAGRPLDERKNSPHVPLKTKADTYNPNSTQSGNPLLSFVTSVTPYRERPEAAMRSLGNGHSLSIVPHLRRRELMVSLQLVLRAAGVDYRAYADANTAYIAVHEENLGELHRVLSSLRFDDGAPIKLWMGRGLRYATIRTPKSLKVSDTLSSDSVVIGAPFTKHKFTIQREGGVEILIVEPRQNRFVPRRPRATKTDWTDAFQNTTTGVAMTFGIQDNTSSEEYVDVVYTWVDSSDQEWQRERAKWTSSDKAEMPSAANDERYLNRDELRYSLRSVALYAPFVRNIYIVTSGHRPDWLVDEDDRVRVISHQEIFPDNSVLPTFNSHAIEACLHKIPGLAENYIYLNDDVFFGREAKFSDFFTKRRMAKSQFSLSSSVCEVEPAPDAIPTDWASYNAFRLIHDEFGIDFHHKHKHSPHAQNKSTIEEMEQRFPSIFTRTRSSRVRSHEDYAVPSMLSHYYGIATGASVEWPNVPKEYVYADTGRADFRSRLKLVLANKPLYFCLNSTLYRDIDPQTQAQIMQKFLQELYPFPSPWEKPVS